MTRKTVNKNNKIGMKIKLERIKLGISQEELAERAYLNKNTIGLIERGEQSPTVDTVEAIANALGLSLQEMFNFNF
ncbi:MAG: helix-turn-helix domain-containing protein [Candidatus Gastranaerophilaceae bacterium]